MNALGLRARALLTGAAILRRLPDGLVYGTAHATGVLLSYLMRRRRALVRANLGRVCRYLDASGMATDRVAAAARDGRQLDALVRDAFGHWLTSYAEGALAPRYDADAMARRVAILDQAVVDEGLAAVPPGETGPIYVGLHFGSVELAALYAARLGHVPVGAPMESVTDPAARAYFARTRAELGVEVLPLTDVAAELTARLARGKAAALVADRPISGAGTRVTFFGAPARLPGGAAVLAVETGARLYPLAIHRLGRGAWVGRMARIDVPATGSRRERVRAVLDAQARAFERFIAAAPEQWWTLFFPVWEDDGDDG